MARQTAVVWAAAAVVGVGRSSVQRWRRWYRAGGLAAVRSRRRGGPGKPAFLTPEPERQVAAAATGVFATAGAVRDWIEAPWGMAYTVAGVYTLLQRLRIRLKTPRPRHTKAAPQAQAAWKKGGSQNAWPPRA